MKKPKEYLEKYNITSNTKHHNYSYLYSAILDIIIECQKDAYNEAIDDAIKEVGCNTSEEQYLLKLKK